VGRHGLLCWQGAADRPLAAIFHFSVVPNGVSVSSVALIGRRLTQAVGRLGRLLNEEADLIELRSCHLSHTPSYNLFV
jgi:hypothetical protein